MCTCQWIGIREETDIDLIVVAAIIDTRARSPMDCSKASCVALA